VAKRGGKAKSRRALVRKHRAAQAIFIAELKKQPNVSRAASLCGYSRCEVYGWRDKYPLFKKAWDDASEEALDALEAIMFKRALVDQSENAAFRLLEAKRGSQFGRNTNVNLKGDAENPVAIGVFAAPPRMSLDEWERLYSKQPRQDVIIEDRGAGY
jgi:hypothetical protein